MFQSQIHEDETHLKYENHYAYRSIYVLKSSTFVKTIKHQE